MVEQTRKITLDAYHAFLESADYDGRIYELIDGEIVPVSPSFESSNTAFEIGWHMGNFVFAQKPRPGYITGADGGYIMPTGEEFNPDVAYISRERLGQKPAPGKPVPMPPDFAVEVVSPSDLQNKRDRIDKKLKTYLDCKIPLLWYVFSAEAQVKVYAHGQFISTAGIDDVLDGGDVLPDFQLPVRLIFPDET